MPIYVNGMHVPNVALQNERLSTTQIKPTTTLYQIPYE
jgi:hypothetical protein